MPAHHRRAGAARPGRHACVPGSAHCLAFSPCPPPSSLQVEYREKLYAVGRIPSTYNKREGAAKEHEVLAARRIDRALRPLFPRGYALDAAVSSLCG